MGRAYGTAGIQQSSRRTRRTMAKEINAGLQIVYRKLSEMHPNPKNPRKQGDDGIVPLAESIEANPQFFEARPILLSDRTGQLVIIGGERRWEAAQYLEMENAPSILFSGLTEEQEDEILIKDNTHAGVWDVQKLQAWDKGRLQSWNVDGVKWPKEEKQVKEDDFNPKKKVKSRVKLGELWKLGQHRLMCGDSTDLETVKHLMGGAKADMVFTDPPYGTTQLAWDKVPNISKMFTCLISQSKDNAALLIFGTQPFITDLINAKRDLFKYEIIWEKTQATGFFNAKKAPLRIHENIVVFYDRLPTYNPIKTTKEGVIGIGRKRKNSDSRKVTGGFMGKVGLEKAETWEYTEDGTRYPTDVVRFSNWNGSLFGNKENAVVHPTQKPIPLAEYFIKTYSNDGEIVLDLFGGSGTTLIAAEQTGRRCFMMELDQHYCDVIIDRWEQFSGQKAEKIQ